MSSLLNAIESRYLDRRVGEETVFEDYSLVKSGDKLVVVVHSYNAISEAEFWEWYQMNEALGKPWPPVGAARAQVYFNGVCEVPHAVEKLLEHGQLVGRFPPE